MSVIVKGMKMPKEGTKTLIIFPDGNVRIWGIDIDSDEWAEAIEVPSPHGRLIDADALKEKKKHSNEFAENIVSVAEIDWMLTIIEAGG